MADRTAGFPVRPRVVDNLYLRCCFVESCSPFDLPDTCVQVFISAYIYFFPLLHPASTSPEL